MAAVYDPDQLEQKEREEKATGDKVGDHEDLSQAEQTAEDLTQHENQVGQGYRKKSNVDEGPSLARKLFVIHRRKTIAGGGAIGLIIGILFGFSVLQGPFQSIQLAQLVQQFHFNSPEDQTDVRGFRLMRFIKSGGNVQEARVGAIASRLGNKMEARFLEAGFKYQPVGVKKYFGGFEIDRENPKFKGRSTADIQAELAREGIPTEVDNRKIVVPAKESYRQNRLLTESMMKRVGYSKISSAMQSRAVAGKWFGFTRWHPMRKADGRLNEILSVYWKSFKKKLSERWGKGSYGVGGSFTGEKRDPIDCEPNCTPEEKAYNEEVRRYNEDIDRQIAKENENIKEVDEDGKKVQGEDQRERPDKTRELAEKYRLRLIGRTAAGAASLTVVLCVINDMNHQYEALKQDRVILPLIREGMEMIAVGNQSMNGQDADLDQLGAYSQYLDDPKTGSWRNAASVQAELGEKSSRQPTEDEIDQKDNLSYIGQASPFAPVVDKANDIIPGFSVGQVCSTTGIIATTVIGTALSFLTGGGIGLVSLVAQGAFIAAASQTAMHLFASFLAGTA
ncbi:hypothetical protein HYU82_00890, partial [Candidatus Saccharibacteria bacterium]|nr:hypothetical protein [Candidatus Saccharibacteria bacterium]